MVVETNERQLTVPIGKEIMGRMFDVFGNTIDHLEALPKGERRNVHQSPPPLSKRSTKSEVFVTGIKAIDVLDSVGTWWQSRIVWRRRCWQNGIAYRDDP